MGVIIPAQIRMAGMMTIKQGAVIVAMEVFQKFIIKMLTATDMEI